MRSVTVSTTMGPGIKIDHARRSVAELRRPQVARLAMETKALEQWNAQRKRREYRRPSRRDLAKAASLVLADFRGITVKSRHRAAPRVPRQRLPYQVVKNTLLGIAVKGTGMAGSRSCFVGPTAIAYSFEDPAAPAKIATKIAKAEEKFVIKGGYVDGKALDAKGVEALSKMPGKDELRATFLATSARRAQNFLRARSPPPRRISSSCWPRAKRASSEEGAERRVRRASR